MQRNPEIATLIQRRDVQSAHPTDSALQRHGINVEAVVQLPRYRKDRLPFVATLEACSSAVLNRALTDIAALDFHVEPPLALPILR